MCPLASPAPPPGSWHLPGSCALAGQYHLEWGTKRGRPWVEGSLGHSMHPMGWPGVKGCLQAQPPLILTFLPTLLDRPGTRWATQPGPCLQSSDSPHILHTMGSLLEGTCVGLAALPCSEAVWCYTWSEGHAMLMLCMLCLHGEERTTLPPFSHALHVAHGLLSIPSANSQLAPTWLVSGWGFEGAGMVGQGQPWPSMDLVRMGGVWLGESGGRD
jgi:hypothetical protein